MTTLPERLIALADALEGLEWDIPLLSVEACREGAERLEHMAGYMADLQRHIRVAVEEDPVRIPPGVLAVVGCMAKEMKP